ncbi:hypothetical protein BH09BAC6_BH09BAC6_03720 [soil metagenome]|jgi:hypothetical protein
MKNGTIKLIFSICFLWLATAAAVRAQTSVITGTVNDNKGNALRYVFVEDTPNKNGALTDSLGRFTIEVNSSSKLLFQLPGYAGQTLNIDKGQTNLQVVLNALGGGDAGGSANSISTRSAEITQDQIIRQAATNFTNLNTSGISGGLTHQKGEVRGNRYMFDNFVHGYIIDPAGQLSYNPVYLFNYDKIDGGILFTPDRTTVNQFNDNQIKTLVLFSSSAGRFAFELMPAIDKNHYVQVLASGPKYKIYKSIKTKFVKSDYVNNGVTAHGNDYDEFVDDFNYYVFDVATNQLQPLSPKKKSIKADFAKEQDKVNKFLNDNSGSIDDGYLTRLGAYMNN